MSPLLLVILYCSLIAAASLAGGNFPTWIRLTHTRMQVLMSFVGGLMLGVALLHLLPHAAAEIKSLDAAVGCVLCGLLAMFFLMRVSHFHQHPQGSEEEEHDHVHEHVPKDQSASHATVAHQLSWVGLFLGLALHTLIDGMALAASVAVTGPTTSAAGLVGGGTFLAILMHKPLDALSITSLMLSARWPRGWIETVNVIFALMCPLGALVFYFSVQGMGEMRGTVVGWALGFACGVFLCISLADILPELQFHRHDRVKLSAALLVGVSLAYGIGLLEPAHQHGAAGDTEATHTHDDHSH